MTLTGLGLAALGFLLLGVAGRGRIRARAPAGLTERRRHRLSVMLLAGATLSFGLTGYLLQLYGYFTVVQGHGAVLGVLALLPILAIVLVTARRAARLALQSDARRLLAGGLAVMGLTTAVTALLLPARPPYWLLVAPLALFGYGCLVAQTAWATAFMSAMPDTVAGASAGILRATGVAGAVLGGALLGTVLLTVGQADLAGRLDALGLPPAQAAAAIEALDAVLRAAAGGDRPAPPPTFVAQGLLALYHRAYTVGAAAALGLAGAGCLGMAALAWLVLEPRRGPPGPAAAGGGAGRGRASPPGRADSDSRSPGS